MSIGAFMVTLRDDAMTELKENQQILHGFGFGMRKNTISGCNRIDEEITEGDKEEDYAKNVLKMNRKGTGSFYFV